MTERTLFPTDDQPDKPLPPKTPHNGTPTSRIAAQQAKTFAASQQEQVFAFIKQAGEHGATDQEIQDALNIGESSERPRRVRLVELGRVADSRTMRMTRSECPAKVWVAATSNQPPVAASKADWPLDTNPDRGGS